MRRTDQRRAAVFALYQRDVTGRPLPDLVDPRATAFTRELVDGVDSDTEELDALIERFAEGWTLERIAPLERAILRVALLEMLHPDVTDAETPIPPEGAIDEAVETAKLYCGAQAPGFVNGILGGILKRDV